MYKEKCKDDTGGFYDMPKDENELKPYKNKLYPVQVHHDFNDLNSIRIFDGHMLFDVLGEDGLNQKMITKIENIKRAIIKEKTNNSR